MLPHHCLNNLKNAHAPIIKENDFYYIKEFLAERNPEKYKNTNDDYDINVISELINKILTQ